MTLLPLLLIAQSGAYSPEIEAIMRRRQAPAKSAPASAATPRAAAEGTLSPELTKRLEACIALANDKPEAGIADATAWAAAKGGAPAAQCHGYALGRAGQWTAAAGILEAGAALPGLDAVSRARLWAQAGNAALVAGNARRAGTALDAALAEPLPDTLATGEIHLDRARVRVALEDLPGARVDLNKAVQLAAVDPLAWLLSATLARRMNDLPLARTHIAEAAKRAGDDASVALEEGVILALAGDQDAAASAAFNRASRLAPGSETARKADAYLAQLGPAPTGSIPAGSAPAEKEPAPPR